MGATESDVRSGSINDSSSKSSKVFSSSKVRNLSFYGGSQARL